MERHLRRAWQGQQVRQGQEPLIHLSIYLVHLPWHGRVSKSDGRRTVPLSDSTLMTRLHSLLPTNPREKAKSTNRNLEIYLDRPGAAEGSYLRRIDG